MSSLNIHSFQHSPFAQDFFKVMNGISHLEKNRALEIIRRFQLVSPTDFLRENFQASLNQGGLNFTPLSSTDQSEAASIQTDLQNQIYTLDPQTQQAWDNINSGLAIQGKPPVDFRQTTRAVEEIMNDPSLSEKEKGKRINDLAKKLGLSKKQMKQFFTKRLAKIYQEAANKINQRLSQAQSDVAQAEQLYGKGSPQALQAQQKLNALSSTLAPLKQQFEAKAQSYNQMFPSFWSKLKGVFTKIGKVFSKIMNTITPFLSFIPGIGQAISLGWNFAKGLFQAIKGNISGAFQQIISGASSLIPGGGILSKVVPIISQASPLISKIASYVPEIGSTLSKGFKIIDSIFKTTDNKPSESPPFTLSL